MQAQHRALPNDERLLERVGFPSHAHVVGVGLVGLAHAEGERAEKAGVLFVVVEVAVHCGEEGVGGVLYAVVG